MKFSMQINIKVFYTVILSFWMCVARHVQSTQNKFDYLHNISRKTRRMKLIVCQQINTKFFCKLIIWFWLCIARYAQSTQNNKFTISLQYLKEIVKDKVDFCQQINFISFFKLMLSF